MNDAFDVGKSYRPPHRLNTKDRREGQEKTKPPRAAVVFPLMPVLTIRRLRYSLTRARFVPAVPATDPAETQTKKDSKHMRGTDGKSAARRPADFRRCDLSSWRASSFPLDHSQIINMP